MGFGWKSKCFSTADEALVAFNLDWASIDGTALLQLVSSSVNASGLITAVARKGTVLSPSMAWSSNSSLTYQLPSCTYDSLANFAVPDVVFMCAVVFCFFIGLAAGQRP